MRLNKAMYCTRDAAQNWEHEYTEFFTEIGFKGRNKQPVRVLPI